MPDTEITALRLLADRVRDLGDRIREMQKTLAELGWTYISPERRAKFPAMLEWWEDRLEHEKDWRYYLPLIMAFIGPVIGGIIVVFVTVWVK